MPLSLLLLASGSYEPPGLLAGLVDAKRREIDRMKLLPDAREDGPWSLRLAYPALTYSSALTDHLSDLTMPAVLADLKRSSPGPKLGEVEWVDQELAVAAALQRAIGLGAAGALISTDTTTYGGSHADLSAARQHLEAFSDAGLESPSMPIIAKDFILDPLQISRAVCQGADAVLIVAAAAAAELPALLDTCTLLGVEALVEVHTVRELQIALECGASLFLVHYPGFPHSPNHRQYRHLSFITGEFRRHTACSVQSALALARPPPSTPKSDGLRRSRRFTSHGFCTGNVPSSAGSLSYMVKSM